MRNKTFQSQFQGPESSPGFLLWKASNFHQRLQREALRELDLTPTQFSILACYFFLAAETDVAVSQSDVGRHAALDKMLVSAGTRALEQKKFIKRLPSKTDGRAFSIRVTPRGAATCNQALRITENLDAEFFDGLDNVGNFTRMLTTLLGPSNGCAQ